MMQHGVVTLSANSGISLQFGQATVLVDALHDQKEAVFSTVSPDLLRELQSHSAFANPDVVFCTHLHPDHYSRKLVAQLKLRCPAAQLILPEREFPEQLLLTEAEQEYRFQNLSFSFIRLPHESAKYASVLHYGVLLKVDGFSVLVAGDCEVASPVLMERLHGERVDLAILPFPWATLSRGRDYLSNMLRPKSLFLCHFPFAEDDVLHYQDAARRFAPRLTDIPDIRFLTNPLQSEEI